MPEKQPIREGKVGRPKEVEILGGTGGRRTHPVPDIVSTSGGDRVERPEILDRDTPATNPVDDHPIMDKVTGEEFDGRTKRERHAELYARVAERSGPVRQSKKAEEERG